MPEAIVVPELAGTLGAASPLAARRFHRAAAGGAAERKFPVVHPGGVVREIILFAPHHRAGFTRWRFQSSQLLKQLGGVAAAQPSAPRDHSRARGRGALAVQGRVQ